MAGDLQFQVNYPKLAKDPTFSTDFCKILRPSVIKIIRIMEIILRPWEIEKKNKELFSFLLKLYSRQ